MPHPLFSPEVRLMLEENDQAGMAAFVENIHPATVAEALDELEPQDIWKFLKPCPIAQQALVFEYFSHEKQEELALGTGREDMAKLIEQMSHDDRVDLLRRLAPSVSESLIRLVDEADRRDIAMLVKYPEDTAGGVMTTDYAWLPEGITVGEALDRLRLQAPNTETLYYVYVLDADRRLLGIVSLRDLILAQRTMLIQDLMETDIYTVNADADRSEVADKLARYDLLAVPVIDQDRKLVGIVTHDDVVDVLVEQATEDAERMGAVVPIGENYIEAGFFTVWRKRVVWLSLLFVAELFTFTALEHYEDAIKAVTVLSLFIPLCIATGGNSGSQAATLITRALALKQVTPGEWWKVLRKELLMGLALGLSLAVICYTRAALTRESTLRNDEVRKESFTVSLAPGQEIKTITPTKYLIPAGIVQNVGLISKSDYLIELPEGQKPTLTTAEGEQRIVSFPPNCTSSTPQINRWTLANIVSVAVAAICMIGTVVGALLPLMFKTLGLDPAVASSPFVAT
ncbi:MAG TPA: magnesium transporter, partial [Gemmatales bacterium]|nr:magnesium transporter [Gemmatales bacterium]